LDEAQGADHAGGELAGQGGDLKARHAVIHMLAWSSGRV
jgi:hypothetical protein